MSEQGYNPETFKEVYELVKDSLDRQVDQGQMLDSKMVQVFSAASVVIGLAGFSVTGGEIKDNAVGVLLVLAILAYILVALSAFRQLSPRTYQLLNYPDIWRKSWQGRPDELHHSVIAKVTDSYERNQPILDVKAGYLRIAIAATGVEIVLVGLALVSLLFG